ncbi:hypothetical protein BDV26DRAFT_283978 [Aspergillus bertholletiae]|uniref:RBR-type E3 ubiquitin transferase n=1 Tax=Aspergillus bertholletiae TaxID=1226010 RepID=A0A5N7B0X9_9EURO|nr:hypothetical protein BDV26DRAFT_283978 [Aspergillus bertholletiae]
MLSPALLEIINEQAFRLRYAQHPVFTEQSKVNFDCSSVSGHGGDNVSRDDSITGRTRSRIIWPEETESCWSDAVTADAVLSLLRKKPVQSPSSNTSRSGGSTPDQDHLNCTVCFRCLRADSYPESPIAAGCDHSNVPAMHICKNCLRQSLEIQFFSSSLGPLTCPICHGQLSDEEVQRWASKEIFEAYDHLRTRQMLEEDAEFVTCIRQDCGYGQLHAGGLEDPIVVCGSCGTRTCFIHRDSAWHEGLTCSEYEDYLHQGSNDTVTRNEIQTSYQMFSEVHALRHGGLEDWSIEAAMTRRTIAETARPCPGCNVATERSGGCKHMTCVLCQQEWCWDCGIHWRRGHLNIECVQLLR